MESSELERVFETFTHLTTTLLLVRSNAAAYSLVSFSSFLTANCDLKHYKILRLVRQIYSQRLPRLKQRKLRLGEKLARDKLAANS